MCDVAALLFAAKLFVADSDKIRLYVVKNNELQLLASGGTASDWLGDTATSKRYSLKEISQAIQECEDHK